MKIDTISTIEAKKITIEYDPIQDRLILHCGLVDKTYATFYLTFRFTRLLITQILSDTRLGDLREKFQHANKHKLLEQQQIILESCNFDNNHHSTNSSKNKADDHNKILETFPLLKTCKISILTGGAVTIVFDLSQSTNPRLIKLMLSNAHLTRFFVALNAQTQIAEWPYEIWTALPKNQYLSDPETIH